MQALDENMLSYRQAMDLEAYLQLHPCGRSSRIPEPKSRREEMKSQKFLAPC